MDDITELLTRLDTASDDELTDARAQITAAIDELRPAVRDGNVTEEQLATLEQLGEQYRAVREAQDARVQAATQRAEAAAGILAGVTDPEDGDGDNPDEDQDGENREISPAQPAADPEAQPDHTAPGEEGSPAAPVAETAPVPVAAAARPPLGTISRTRTAGAPPARTNRPVTITAAADTGFAAGQNLTARQLAEAFTRRLQAVGKARGGDGELVHVATFTAQTPAERILKRGQDATTQIEQITGARALVAAGGLCAPFTPDYSIDVEGDVDRPIRDALAGFQAERGGIYFRPDLDGAATAPGASGVWTNANDAAVGTGSPPAPKPYGTVTCPDMVQAEVEAETFQLEFSNVTTRFDPESTAANIQAALVAHARWSENRLLAKLQAGSTLVTYDHKLGAVRDYLVMLDQILAYYRSLHRLKSTAPLRMILPFWLLYLFRADVARALHTSNQQYFSMPDSWINQWFADRSVTPTWHMDGAATDTAAAAGPPATPAISAQQYANRLAVGDPVPGFPNQVDALLFREGKWLHLDGGTLDLGIVRDSQLIENNRYRTFTEEWVGVAFRGIESLRVVATLQPTGGSAGTVDTSAFTD